MKYSFSPIFIILCQLPLLVSATEVQNSDSKNLSFKQNSISIPKNLKKENLVAWCIVPFDSKMRSPSDRVRMLQQLGITKVAYDWRNVHVKSFEEEFLLYDKNNIELVAFWDTHPSAINLFRKMNLRPQIWKTAPSPNKDKFPSQQNRVEQSARLLEPVIREGFPLGLYNHGGWGGEPENLVALCIHLRKKWDTTEIGIVYNLHHAHHRIETFEEDLKLMVPYLMCLNLNGMNPKAEPKILELGKGTFDSYWMRTIQNSDYKGLIGIIDHQHQKDTEVVLRKNLDGLIGLIKISSNLLIRGE